MQINGRSVVQSDTLIVPAGDSATINFPFGNLSLMFVAGQNPSIDIVVAAATVTFTGFDNPIGTFGGVNVPTSNGPVFVSFWVYGIGSPASHLVMFNVMV